MQKYRKFKKNRSGDQGIEETEEKIEKRKKVESKCVYIGIKKKGGGGRK